MVPKSKSHTRPAYRTSADDQPIPAALRDHDAQVLNVRQWSQLAGFSTRTAKRLFKAGIGPRVVQLSANRVGVTLAAHKAWVAARTRGQRRDRHQKRESEMREPPARGAPRAVRDFQKNEPAVKRLEDGGSCEFI